MSKPKWPTPHDDHLKDCFNNSLTHTEAAASLNAAFGTAYSRNACIGRAARLGLKRTDRMGGRKIAREALTRQRKSTAAKVKRGLKCEVVAPAMPEPPPAPTQALGTFDLLDLQRGQCRFPFGEGPIRFCGAPQAPGYSYCNDHAAVTHNPGVRR
jgi:GcrA cell cycle regulator